MLREVIQNPVQMDAEGYIPVPQGAGLGIEINEEALKHFCINL
jgi:L-alanine-DL-glutamate epimerase-like enolase superfamily enzyme